MVSWDGRPPGEEEVRARLFAGLNERRVEMERAILARVCAVSGPAEPDDGEYMEGLRGAVTAGVGYGLAGVERGEDPTRPIPAGLLSQARKAARSGVALEVVLRRCFAGFTVFGDFLMQTAEDGIALQGHALGRVVHAQSALLDPLVAAVVDEHTRERGHRQLSSPQQRQVKQVKKLLAGESADPGELAYEFGDWHIGAIARGDDASATLRRFAGAADRRLLLVRPDGETAWAWFGGRRRIELAEADLRGPRDEPGDALIALGEPARGIEGWRLTHQQASAALRVTQIGARGIVRYAEVGLLASISQDRVLASSLRQMYLAPLANGRDGGVALRETLRAYFSAGRNISSAASALGLSRQTVRTRLHAIEDKLGRSLDSCAPEIEVALRLESIGGG